MFTASIEIETRPFLDFLEHLADPSQMVNEIVVTFNADTLELDAETVVAVFPGQGEGKLEIVLERRQARWLAGTTRTRLPEHITVSATPTSLTIHNETMSWGGASTLDESSKAKGPDELDLLTAALTIDHRRLDELDLLDAALMARDRARSAASTATDALAHYSLGRKRLASLIRVQAMQRLEDWRATCNPLAREAKAHPAEGFFEPKP